jgi:hypothetical protein
MAEDNDEQRRRERVEKLMRELDALLDECFLDELQPAMDRAKKALGINDRRE